LARIITEGNKKYSVQQLCALASWRRREKKGVIINEERKMELRATYNRSKAHLRPLLFLLLAFLAGCLAAGLFFNRQRFIGIGELDTN